MSQPAFDDFESWLKMHLTDTLPKSAIGQAIQYALPRIEKLRRFINNVNPQIWLADVLVKINNAKIAELSNLLTANWKRTIC